MRFFNAYYYSSTIKKMSSKEIEDNNKNDDNDIKQCLNCAFQTFTTFATDSVVRLSTNAFSIKEKALIALEYNECFLVLFYTENAESKNLAKIWSVVAQQTPGPIFAGCNVLLEKKVAEAFAKVRAHPSHAFKPYALHGWPVIIVYREGFPTAVYNGPYEVQSISDWALTLACSAGYFEPVQDYGGIQAYNLLETEKPTPYVNVPGKPPTKKVVSSEYSRKGIRGTNPNIPLVLEGSDEDKKATIASRQQEAEKLGYRLTNEAASSNLDNNPDEQTEEELIGGKDIQFNEGKPPIKKVSESEKSESEKSESEKSESEKSESENTRSENTGSENTESEKTESEKVNPKTANPKTANLKTANPKTANPKTTNPKKEIPKRNSKTEKSK